MKKIIISFFVLAAVAAAALFFAATNEEKCDFFAMDTLISVKVEGLEAKSCSEELQKRINSLDGEMLSRFSDSSQLAEINSQPQSKPDARLLGYLEKLLEVCRLSGGKYDITLGSVSDLWSFTDSPRVPSEDELATALSHAGYEKTKIDGDTFIRTDAEAVIDLGSAGKGIALDEAREILDKKNVRSAVISVGGSILLYGKGSFTVGVRDPWGDAGRSVITLKLSESCVSTSGSYERQFESDGKSYHHILDPDTGMPAENGLVSVTIISDSGLLSDALSTACFVLGVEDGIALAKKLGCEAIFITENKKIICTDGVRDKITVLEEEYSFES